MMPTVSRSALNNADDIMREAGVMKSARRTTCVGFGTVASQCAGKTGFASFRAAEVVARKRDDLSTYRCRYCHKWHVGGRLDR